MSVRSYLYICKKVIFLLSHCFSAVLVNICNNKLESYFLLRAHYKERKGKSNSILLFTSLILWSSKTARSIIGSSILTVAAISSCLSKLDYIL